MSRKFCNGKDFIIHEIVLFTAPFCPLCISLDDNRKLKVLNTILEEIMATYVTCAGRDKSCHSQIMYNKRHGTCPLCLALESKGFTWTDADKIVESIKQAEKQQTKTDAERRRDEEPVTQEQLASYKDFMDMRIGIIHQKYATQQELNHLEIRLLDEILSIRKKDLPDV